MNAGTAQFNDVDLDHVGFIVRDLDASCAFLARLGFALTTRADHTRTDEQGQLVSAGSSQRSIMLRRGYIEIMQITDPRAGHQLATAPTVRFGLHVLAFGTHDATACHRQRVADGVAVGPVLNWARPVDQAGARGLARFTYFGSAWDPHDPSYLCWVEHRTPELLRPAELLRHDNGALALAGIHYRGPRQLASQWAGRLAAAGARMDGEHAGGMQLALPGARLWVHFDEAAVTLAPTALVLEFSDLDRMRARCVALGVVMYELAGGALELDLRQQLGMVWICRAESGVAIDGSTTNAAA